MTNPRISVIVPIYNAEKFLPRCIDSILAQTFTDFEVLLIDDGSTDSSGTICDEYAKTDSRIRVCHKTNGGVSSARNVGLENALGEWITFVDSDDILHERFLDYALHDIPDFVDISFVSFEKRRKDHVIQNYILPDIVYDRRNLNIFFCNIDIMEIGYPWGRIYRRNVISKYKIFFDEGLSLSEDRLFFYNYLIYANGISLHSQIGYYYNMSGNGLSTVKQSKSQIQERFCKLDTAAKELRLNLNLSIKEYTQIWLQQVVYLSVLIDASLMNCHNPFTRYSTFKRIYKENFDHQYFNMLKYENPKTDRIVQEKLGYKSLFLVRGKFLLYELSCFYRDLRNVVSLF